MDRPLPPLGVDVPTSDRTAGRLALVALGVWLGLAAVIGALLAIVGPALWMSSQAPDHPWVEPLSVPRRAAGTAVQIILVIAGVLVLVSSVLDTRLVVRLVRGLRRGVPMPDRLQHIGLLAATSVARYPGLLIVVFLVPLLLWGGSGEPVATIQWGLLVAWGVCSLGVAPLARLAQGYLGMALATG
ncbi:MAG: hypothetical protein Q4G40_09660, partial [Brachybacterium sp.]|nr:hypothetical protein [Brachybacterium sp.]